MSTRIQTKENKIFSLVRNLKEYGYYKKDANAASKLLSKAFPSISKSDALEIIEYYGSLYENLSTRIRNHKEEVLRFYNQMTLKQWMTEQGNRYTNKDRFGLDEEKLALAFTGFLVDWIMIR